MLAYKEKLLKQRFAVYDAAGPKAALHRHNHLELAYVKSGSMAHLVDGKRYILHAGDYFIIDHAMSHSYKSISDEPLLVRNIIFAPSFLDKGLTGSYRFRDLMSSYLLRFCYQALRGDPTGIPFPDEDGHIAKLVDLITAEYEAERFGHLEYIRCLLVEVLILTMRKLGKEELPASKSAIVGQMMRYADEHYQTSLRLNTLAKQLGYSAAYLSQKFSKEMGMSFMDYVHELRIRRACYYLETSDLKIAQIAEAVGYDGTKYFNQMFKRRMGVTPKLFRSIHRSAG